MPKTLLGTKEVGDVLGWSRQKVSVYYSRGKLPEPYALAGSRPLWTRTQIDKWMEGRETK